MWVMFAFGSALFAGLTAILAKCGIKNTDSNVATALRTVVVLVFSWIMVYVTGAAEDMSRIEGRTLLFLILSGLATGASWLCYFRALQLGDVNRVTPVDKSSVVLTMLLAFVFLGEELTLLKVVSMVLIGGGTWMMVWKKTGKKRDLKRGIRKEVSLETTGQGESKRAGDREKKGIAGLTRWKGAWFFYAAASAVFASLTSILGKLGMEDINSNLGTAIRTIVVLVMAWIVVGVTGKLRTIKKIDKKSWIFLILSGCTTGSSWLCYYRALQTGEASIVVPIDKLSIVLTVLFAYLVFHEKLSKKAFAGLVLIVAGTLLLLV